MIGSSPRLSNQSQGSESRIPLNMDIENHKHFDRDECRKWSFFDYYTIISTMMLFILVIVLYCLWGTQSKTTNDTWVSKINK